jgi:hypothetical protein
MWRMTSHGHPPLSRPEPVSRSWDGIGVDARARSASAAIVQRLAVGVRLQLNESSADATFVAARARLPHPDITTKEIVMNSVKQDHSVGQVLMEERQ